MIKVLESWLEIGRAVKSLASRGLPLHATAEKCWDLWLLEDLVTKLPKDARIVDLGCGDLFALKLLHELQFFDLTGIDLAISAHARLSQLARMVRRRTLRRPFRLVRGDITRTSLAPASIDVACCLSVIEHGVPLEPFVDEAARILKPNGRLLVTTDYWEDEIAPPDTRPFGLEWRPFSRATIERLIELARARGLALASGDAIPPCKDRCVVWNGREYTFIALAFVKEEKPPRR